LSHSLLAERALAAGAAPAHLEADLAAGDPVATAGMVSPYFVPLQTISNTAARPALSGDPLSWHTSDGAPRSPARNITVARLPGTEGTTRGAPIAIEDTGWTAGISTSRFLAITADPSRPERLYAAGAGQREDLVSIYASQDGG